MKIEQNAKRDKVDIFFETYDDEAEKILEEAVKPENWPSLASTVITLRREGRCEMTRFVNGVLDFTTIKDEELVKQYKPRGVENGKSK